MKSNPNTKTEPNTNTEPNVSFEDDPKELNDQDLMMIVGAGSRKPGIVVRSSPTRNGGD